DVAVAVLADHPGARHRRKSRREALDRGHRGHVADAHAAVRRVARRRRADGRRADVRPGARAGADRRASANDRKGVNMSVTAVHVERPASFLTRPIVSAAVRDSFAKLHPRVQFRNPVMFVVFLGSIYTTLIGIGASFGMVSGEGHPVFVLAISAWLWLT